MDLVCRDRTLQHHDLIVKIFSIPFVAIALFLSGCSTMAVDPIRSGSTLISEADKMPSVKVTPKLAALVNAGHVLSVYYETQSGKVFSEVFTGAESATATMDLSRSEIFSSVSSTLMILPTVNVRFEVTVKLHAQDGREFVFSAFGIAHSKRGISQAIREATELAALEIAKKTRAMIGP